MSVTREEDEVKKFYQEMRLSSERSKVLILVKFGPFCIADPNPLQYAIKFIWNLYIHRQMIILMYNLRRSIRLPDDVQVGISYILEASAKLGFQEFDVFLE